MDLAASQHEQLRLGLQAVVTEEREHRVDEGRLPVGAGPVEEEENVLPDIAGERVADRPLQEVDQLGVISHHHVEECLDRWKLNVENGTIDLRTGKLLPHDPADLITN